MSKRASIYKVLRFRYSSKFAPARRNLRRVLAEHIDAGLAAIERGDADEARFHFGGAASAGGLIIALGIRFE